VAHRFIDLPLAEAAFEAEAADLGGLLETVGEALCEALVTDPAAVRPAEERRIRVGAEDGPGLVRRFLEEVLAHREAEGLLLSGFRVDVRSGPGIAGAARVADVVARGEPFDLARHRTRLDVAAVAARPFEVVEEGGAWRARVALDVRP